jgi:hypothetical protein
MIPPIEWNWSGDGAALGSAIGDSGTQDNPVLIDGGGQVITASGVQPGNWSILKNFVFDPGSLVISGRNHVAIVDCEFRNRMRNGGNGTCIFTTNSHDIVIHNAHIHDNGRPIEEITQDSGNDFKAVFFESGTHDLWMFQSRVYNIASSVTSIAMYGGNAAPHSLYLFQNDYGRTREGFGIKGRRESGRPSAPDSTRDVFIVDNVFHDQAHSLGFSEAKGVGIKGDAHYIWIIGNTFRDSNRGICDNWINSHIFIVNNHFENILDASASGSSGWQSGATLRVTNGSSHSYFIGNTVVNCRSGTQYASGNNGTHYVWGNSIGANYADINNDSGSTIWVGNNTYPGTEQVLGTVHLLQSDPDVQQLFVARYGRPFE